MQTATTHSSWNTASRSKQERSALQQQFAKPRGWLGRLVGWWMARANERYNRAAIRALRVSREDSILEIGFGPGEAIARLAEKSRAAFIAGVDPSEEMQRQATARNQRAIWAGRVTLAQATVEALPFDDCQFSKAFAVRNLLVWDDPARGLAEIRRVLKPGGKLVICQVLARRNPRWYDTPGISASELRDSIQLLQQSGFESVRVRRSMICRRTICLISTRGRNPVERWGNASETVSLLDEATCPHS